MPCDTEYDHDNADLFRDVLTEVSTLSLKLNTDHVIFAGDFNTDMSRHNSLHTQILCKFTDEESLCKQLNWNQNNNKVIIVCRMQ